MALRWNISAVACRKVCLLCTHHTIDIICSAIGQSIASVYDLSTHIYLGVLLLSKCGALVV